MRIVFVLVLFIIATVVPQEIQPVDWIAKDYDCGIEVTMKEKYGGYFKDTCNVVYEDQGKIYLITKDGIKAVYSLGSASLIATKKIECAPAQPLKGYEW